MSSLDLVVVAVTPAAVSRLLRLLRLAGGGRPHSVLDQLTLQGDVGSGDLLSPLLFHLLLLLTQKQHVVCKRIK